VGLGPLAYWDCGFESRRRHGILSLVSVACCQVEVSAEEFSCNTNYVLLLIGVVTIRYFQYLEFGRFIKYVLVVKL
jgi:hypothetical protein